MQQQQKEEKTRQGVSLLLSRAGDVVMKDRRA